MSAAESSPRHVIEGVLGVDELGPSNCAERVSPVRRPAHVARMLALAHHIQWTIDRSESVDRAAVARELGFTRARITQVLDLLLLAPDIQVALAELDAVDGVEPLSEHSLRHLARHRLWAEQRRLWRELRKNQRS